MFFSEVQTDNRKARNEYLHVDATGVVLGYPFIPDSRPLLLKVDDPMRIRNRAYSRVEFVS